MDPSPRRPPRGRGPSTSGTLFVVATPIGNLEDITLRALRVLREVAVVAAEDTRRTGNLLRHYQIDTPLFSLREHNEQRRAAAIIRRLDAGESIALVSDAGTPGISDPGALLVRAVREAGFHVDPIPGASAVTAALSACGLSLERFGYAGFPPVRSNARKTWFDWVGLLRDVPVVCFEAPHRVRRTLEEMRVVFVDRPIIIARELTKAHEEWSFVTVGPQREALDVREKGEIVLILGPTTKTAASAATPSDAQVAHLFGQLTANGLSTSRRAAIKAVAAQLGVSTKAVFEALERTKSHPT